MQTIKVVVGDRFQLTTQDKALDVAAELRAAFTEENGPNSPAPMPTFEPIANVAVMRGKTIDVEGKARSEADRAAATSAGFVTADTVYARGTMVVDAGVANAREYRQQFEEMPPTVEGCARLDTEIRAEARRDSAPMRTAELVASPDGRFIGPDAQQYAPTRRAIAGLVTRLGCGGVEYLADHCDERLFAVNVNAQTAALDRAEAVQLAEAQAKGEKFKPSEIVLRTRVRGGRPEAFAVVSPGYTSFDGDRVASLVKAGVSPDCRGEVRYDAVRGKIRIEALLNSTVQPEKYVAGEFFRAGVVIKADDTGAGGIEISSVVYQNLCLNLVILDKAWQRFGSVVHRGDENGLTLRVRDALKAASASIDHFRKAWGFAAVDDVAEQVMTTEGVRLHREIAMAALFRGILKGQLVALPGRKEERVKELVEAWKGDHSSATVDVATSRASVVNAFTRLAHTSDLDPWQADEVSADAARLLLRKQPLPFELSEARS